VTLGCVSIPLLLFAYCTVVLFAPGSSPESACSADGYKRLAGNIWPGVQVYYGSPGDRTLLERVETTASNHIFPNGNVESAVLVETTAGDEMWMPRSVLRNDGWYVRCADPALR
jgi:hypothetical protein